eukprot:3982049-Prymnesium_polylepis.1
MRFAATREMGCACSTSITICCSSASASHHVGQVGKRRDALGGERRLQQLHVQLVDLDRREPLAERIVHAASVLQPCGRTAVLEPR